jgi:S1-C subfamily serine protease
VENSAVGWLTDGGLVVTVAHAVRGSTAVTADGRSARVVAIDNRADVAVLAPEAGLDAAGLRIATDSAAGPVWLARFIGTDRFVTRAEAGPVLTASVDEPVDATTYTRTAFRIDVALTPGDSGAPIVNGEGRATGMAFATARDGSSLTYAVAVDDIRATLGRVGPTSPAVDTGRCG